VNARLAALLTALHAPGWRRRYGTEFHALLEELPATPDIVASATGSAFSSHAPALATVGAFALAAAVLALGPAASDRRTVTMHQRAPYRAPHSWPSAHPANVACTTNVAQIASDGNIRC
jgi:hypothetical protein